MNTIDEPKPSYGYYLVDIDRDGVAPQPGDQYWHAEQGEWRDRSNPKTALRFTDVYQRRVPEIPGYRLLELDEEIVPGTIFFLDGDRDFADPDLHIKTRHRSKVVRCVVEEFNSYIAFYAPMTVIEKEAEESTKVNSGWLPIDQFDPDKHLPCLVTDGDRKHIAENTYGDERPQSDRGDATFDSRVTLFLPIPPIPYPTAFAKWWERQADKTHCKNFARRCWNAAIEDIVGGAL